MPDEPTSEPDLPAPDSLAQTAAVQIPAFHRPVKVTEATNEDVIMVPDVEPARGEITEFEATVNLTGDALDALKDLAPLPGDAPPADAVSVDAAPAESTGPSVTRTHLKGLLEALIFASDHPQKASELAKAASAVTAEVKELLGELKVEYQPRGIQLDEIAGGWQFRTSSAYAPFVRDLTKQKPVRLSRAQLETLAILAYRQPVTRPEIDDIRGVDSGPVLKLLLERDLVRILGKKDEPGRPMIYGTTTAFLEFFGLKSLKDLPTLREFTELNEDSRRVAERELGEELFAKQPEDATPSESVVPPAAPLGEVEINESTPPLSDDDAFDRADTIPPTALHEDIVAEEDLSATRTSEADDADEADEDLSATRTGEPEDEGRHDAHHDEASPHHEAGEAHHDEPSSPE